MSNRSNNKIFVNFRLKGRNIFRKICQKGISNKGFTILEQAITLGILSIIIASGAIYLEKVSDSQKASDTSKRIEVIRKAIVSHYLDNSINGTGGAVENRFPCPASPTDSQTSTNFGREVIRTNHDCLASRNVKKKGTYFYGVVPIRTLELPDRYMFDGWGRRFSYIVDKSNISQINKDFGAAQLGNFLYHIISHGSNGKGAYNAAGIKIPAGSNSNEINNSIDASNYGNITVLSAEQNFDDIVVQKKTIQFVRDIAGTSLPSPALCSYVKAISSSDNSCKAFQTKLEMMCLSGLENGGLKFN